MLQLFQAYELELMSKKNERNFAIMRHRTVISIQKVIHIVVSYFINCVWVRCFFCDGINLTFLLLPTWYTNFLFIHICYIKLNSSTCFERNPLIVRRSTMQIVHMQPLVSSLSASDRLAQPLRKDSKKKVILWCTANQISKLA